MSFEILRYKTREDLRHLLRRYRINRLRQHEAGSSDEQQARVLQFTLPLANDTSFR